MKSPPLLFALLICIAALSPQFSAAQSNGSKPILIVSGNITSENTPPEVSFTREDLEAMMTATVRTSTPWFDGQSVFEGVPLRDLLAKVNAQGTTITAIALNDYITEIPMSDLEAYNPMLALKRNGQFMSVRDKGPLFVIYAYDSNPELQTHLYYARSAWQVAKLVIK